ncbi:hypothetical protein K8P10_002002 [Leucobacter sp. Psy1]|nr:hypothetical protein K8P10_002002 [Leucobacter sp. Psy1]
MIDHERALAKAATRLADAIEARSAAIVAAYSDHMKVTHIADAVGLSRAQVHRILNDAGVGPGSVSGGAGHT